MKWSEMEPINATRHPPSACTFDSKIMFSRSVLRVVNKTPASEATFVVKATVKEAVGKYILCHLFKYHLTLTCSYYPRVFEWQGALNCADIEGPWANEKDSSKEEGGKRMKCCIERERRKTEKKNVGCYSSLSIVIVCSTYTILCCCLLSFVICWYMVF